MNIEARLKNSEGTHTFKGKGVKKDNEISYDDENVQTKIIIGNIITIIRKGEYFIKINLKKGINLSGIYITKYGKFNLKTYTSKLEIKENEIEIIYKLYINDNLLDTFSYNLKFSLDT